jgi:hypothetical protein
MDLLALKAKQLGIPEKSIAQELGHTPETLSAAIVEAQLGDPARYVYPLADWKSHGFKEAPMVSSSHEKVGKHVF